MKKKYLFYIISLGLLIFISVPTIHLLRTKLAENRVESPDPKGYTDDESHLNRTKIDSLVFAASDSLELILQLKSLLDYASKNNLKVSIAGTKHSMGGHTISENGILLNMLPNNHMSLDTLHNVLTIGSGATWEQAIRFIDPYERSISIMQAFNTFSVGGSISVNGHGWQKNLPPLSNSVKSFRLMLANGDIKTCSRTENEELFHLVVGGYGLFGVILDVRLNVQKNAALKYKYVNMSTNNYLKYYNEYITNNPKTELVFGRLRVSQKRFLEEATLNFFERTPYPPEKINFDSKKNTESKRLIFRGSVDSEYGKRLRWELEKVANTASKNNIYSRNELLNDDVSLIENKDSTSTDILHEYFVPERNFMKFINAIKPHLQASEVDLLNITIRRVETDHDAFLNYAKEPVYGFVILFNQKRNKTGENAMILLTEALVDCVISAEGTYYLPYRLHVSKKKMYQVYPQAPNFFEKKREYDPQELFSNTFYEKYK